MAKITIIGAGNMARGIATRWAGEENEIQVLAPTSEHAASLAEELGGGARAGGVNDAIEGDIVVLATPYDGALDFVFEAGRRPDGQGSCRHHEPCGVGFLRPFGHTTGFLGRAGDRGQAAGGRSGGEGFQHDLRRDAGQW